MSLPQQRMLPRPHPAVLVLLLVACAGTLRAQLPGTVAARSMIEGRVMTPGNEPLRGVTVVLVDFNGASRRTAFTDDSGAFVFVNLRPGSYQLQASLAGYEPQTIRVDHDGERDNSLQIILRQRPAAAEFTIGAASSATAVWALRIPPAAQEEYNRGIQQMQQKHNKTAQEHFAKATEIYPQYAAAHAALGSLALGEKDVQAAQGAFARAIEIDDNLLDAQLGLASIAVGEKHYEEAREHLLKARGLKADDWRILHQLGETEWQLGLYEDAEPNLRRAAELHADSPRTHLLLINVLALQEKLPETLAAMDNFLKLFPKNSFAAQIREKREKLKHQLESAPAKPLVNLPDSFG